MVGEVDTNEIVRTWNRFFTEQEKMKRKRFIPHTSLNLKVIRVMLFLDHSRLHKSGGSKNSQFCGAICTHLDNLSGLSSTLILHKNIQATNTRGQISAEELEKGYVRNKACMGD